MSGRKYILGIIGMGNMAEAILKGIMNSCFLPVEYITAFEKDKNRIDYIQKKYGLKFQSSLSEFINNARHILIAVKPKDIVPVLKDIRPFIDIIENKIISIAAGVPTGLYERLIKNISTIRIMPNTPAFLNKGVSAISRGRFASDADIGFATGMIKSVGDCIIIDEELQDVVTAVSGSGPAYFFLFCNYIIDAAVKKGMDKKTAARLVTGTASGAAAMLEEFDSDTEKLIKMVCSPGGTTEAALMQFAKDNFNLAVENAVEAALIRAREIQKNIQEMQ